MDRNDRRAKRSRRPAMHPRDRRMPALAPHDMTQTVRQEQALKRIETLTAVIACKSRADLGNAMAGMSQGGFEDFDDEGE